MSFSCLVDKTALPDDQVVFDLLGEASNAWREIESYLVERKAKPAFKFYGKNYGWALRFVKSGKSIIALYPTTRDFYLQIILNAEQEQTILEKIQNDEVKRVISSTPRAYEGKWIFIKYSDFKNVEEIKKMVDIRMSKA